MLDLTIVIPVRNEEKNLPHCLSAIGKDFVKKIFIIDSDSNDNTKSIAFLFGIEVIDFIWNGTFPKKRNWFLENHAIVTNWVLFLDADEYLTEDFKKELSIALDDKKISGYWLTYTTYFMGKKLHGGYPLKKLALFRAGAGTYEKIDEERWTLLDMEIHEHPIIVGKTGSIKSKIDHRDLKNVREYIGKHTEYALWEAKRFLKMSDRSNVE